MLKGAGHQAGIQYGDITRTDYVQESFGAIACLSVVEHGVNPESYFKEMW
jgi:hypothetical protein